LGFEYGNFTEYYTMVTKPTSEKENDIIISER